MNPTSTGSADHARHDRLLVLRYLDRDDDLQAAEVGQARSLVSDCRECAALAVELQQISDATRSMALPSRPRDYRLTPEQARSLRARSGAFGRLSEALGSIFRTDVLRPLAGAAVAVGFLLAVIGSFPLTGGGTVLTSTKGSEAGAADAATASGAPAAATVNSTDSVQLTLGSAPPPAASPEAGNQSTAAGPNTPSSGTPGSQFAASESPEKSGDTTGNGGRNSTSPEPLLPAPTPAATQIAVADGTPAPEPPTNPGVTRARDQEGTVQSLSPVLVFGVLLATVGIVVILLTFVARRNSSAN